MASGKRLPMEPRFPNAGPEIEPLARALKQGIRDLNEQVNRLAEGRQGAHYNEATAAPTTGVYALGDFVRHGSAHETGTVGSKYMFAGWGCVSEGSASAASFVEVRWTTGN